MCVSPHAFKPGGCSLLVFIVSCSSVFLAEGALDEDGSLIVFPTILFDLGLRAIVFIHSLNNHSLESELI